MNDLMMVARVGEEAIGMLAVGGGLVIAVFAMTIGYFKSRHKELTRREIAAYVAEGSMTPEEGERLLKAGRD